MGAVDLIVGVLCVAVTLALLVTGYRRPAAAAAVVSAIVLISLAETPFGIGNGTVPDLVGVDECSATGQLEERGLRWRFGRHSPVGGRPTSCAGDGPFSVADDVLGQRPAPGRRLGESDIVTLETACTRERHCSRLGRYEHGLR